MRETDGIPGQAEQDGQAPRPSPRYLSAEQVAAYKKKVRWRQRWDKIRRKIRSSRIVWFFSAHTEDPRQLLTGRTTLARARYERFRLLVSWTNIARLQSSYTVKLGLTGLVVAPLMATAFLHIPSLQPLGFPKQFGFLFLSGLSFVLSAVLFRMRCPVLLLEMLSRTTQARDSLRRNDLLEALVSTEFVNLVTWRRYPADRALHRAERGKDELAVTMLANGYDPALAGYGPRQFAMIERAIYEFANSRSIKVWTSAFNEQEKRRELVPGYGPRVVYEGGRPYVVQFEISKPDRDILEHQAEVGADDLVLDWHETNLDHVAHLPKPRDINVSRSYARGLHHLFSSDDAADAFGWIVSKWQDHRRGFSRLAMFALYAASIALFACFLWLQTEIVLKAMHWI